MKNTFFSRMRGLLLLSLCGFFSASIHAAPKLNSAYIVNVQTQTADVYVSADGAVKYYCHMIRTGYDGYFDIEATNGMFQLTSMQQCTAHTLRVWAKDAAGTLSEDSITLTYSTLGDGINLYLRGINNDWTNGLQFRKTPVSDVFALTTYLNAGQYSYKLYDTGYGSETSGDNRGLKVLNKGYVTFYAKGTDCFASTVDSIYVASPSLVTKYACQWIDSTAVWVGSIDSLKSYNIAKKCAACGDSSFPDWWYKEDLSKSQSISGISTSASFAKFTFDLPTLSWKWEELDVLCTTTGTDYSLSLYLNADNTALQVSATSTKTTVPTAATFHCYDYTSADKDYTADLKTLVTDGTTYIASVPLSELPKSADNKICYNVVFTYSDNSTLTTDTLFYSLAGGCTTDTLRLCHHGQSEGDYTTEAFSGTRVVQPIVYRRKFAPGYWETLCLPFDVTKMWVYDTDDKQDCNLYPQYIINGKDTISGYYWLRTFSGENIEAASADKSWQTAASAANYLPAKNTPYIIMFPEGDYYKDKYVYFAASGFRTIASAFSPSRPTVDDTYSYIGNTTLQEQKVTNAYLLVSGNEYFDASTDGTGTLYPFECALFATEKTVARAPRLRINRRQETPTDILPTTAAAAGEVYTLWGNRVGAFASWDDYDALVRHLPAGLYIIRSGSTSRKICLTK